MVTAPPEIVTVPDDTAIVENAVPPALVSLNVILPVPLITVSLKVITILEACDTPVAPIAGLKVIGLGGTFILVNVAMPAFILPVVSILPVVPIPTPVSPEPLPTKEVAVIIPIFCIFLLSSITVVPEILIAIVVDYSAFYFIYQL
jgi:hypothetical protein